MNNKEMKRSALSIIYEGEKICSNFQAIISDATKTSARSNAPKHSAKEKRKPLSWFRRFLSSYAIVQNAHPGFSRHNNAPHFQFSR